MRGFPKRFPVRDDDRKPLRYRVVCGLLHLVFTVFFAGRLLHIEGEENLPEHGPLLIVANHLSEIDPLLFGAYGPGVLYAMGKREIFELFPLAPWILAGCNCFPVDRARGDRWAFTTAIGVLRRGGRLLVFLEGTRAPRPGMQHAQQGVGFMLKSTGAAVIPCGIWGSEKVLGRHMKLPHRARITIRYGAPITGLAETSTDPQVLADRCAVEIAALLPEEYRGMYAEAGC